MKNRNRVLAVFLAFLLVLPFLTGVGGLADEAEGPGSGEAAREATEAVAVTLEEDLGEDLTALEAEEPEAPEAEEVGEDDPAGPKEEAEEITEEDAPALDGAVSTSGYNASSIYLAFGSDRHGNPEAIALAMSGMPETVSYVGVVGDMVNSSDSYKTSTIYGEVTALFGTKYLTYDSVDIFYGDHDKGNTDDAGIMNGQKSSGHAYTARGADGGALYHVYAVSYDAMTNAATARTDSAAFMDWVDKNCADTGVPIFVVSHVPMHAERSQQMSSKPNDNPGGAIWHEAINYAATGEKTTDAGKEIIRNVIFIHGHNHTVPRSKLLNYAPMSTVGMQGIESADVITCTIGYSYLTAGYMGVDTDNHIDTANSLLVEITDTGISFYRFPASSVGAAVKLHSVTRTAGGEIRQEEPNGDVNGDDAVIADSGTEEASAALVKNASGTWVYTVGDEVDKSYTGLARNEYGWWYVKNGVLDLTYTGMAKNAYGWWYVTKGRLDLTYTGMAKNAYGWWYMTKGKLDLTYTGMAKNAYGWWYMTKGKLDLTYTGLAKNAYGTWYMVNGRLAIAYSGTVTYRGRTYTVVKGKATMNQ